MLSIAGLLIGLITRRALMSRVHSIRHTVSAIIHGDLKHRLPTDLSHDELNTLASTINGMLDQIEQLVHGVRNVSNSIAHDLRTPLAELRSRLEELALIRPPPEATFAEIDGAVADVDRVIRIFDALLRLAEIDAGLRRSGFVAFDLVDSRHGGGVLRARGGAQEHPPAIACRGVRSGSRAIRFCSRRRSAISIDNALKYTPQNGTHRCHFAPARGRARGDCRDRQRPGHR